MIVAESEVTKSVISLDKKCQLWFNVDMSRVGYIAVALLAALGGCAALVLGYTSLLERPPSNQVVLHIEEVSPNGDGLLVDALPAPLLTLAIKSPSESLTPGATVLCLIQPDGSLKCGDAILESAGCLLHGGADAPETKMAALAAGGSNGVLRSEF